jgi:hypothetical protein
MNAAMSTRFRRGIAPDLLQSQVRNTMPYLFEAGTARAALERFEGSEAVLGYGGEPTESLDQFSYFRLCLSAHYLTCSTPVPTDVDNQIRKGLWPADLPLETALQMAALVLESRRWDFRRVTGRYAYGAPGTPWSQELLTGLYGEWFSVAAGSYCALKQYGDDALASSRGQELFEAISDEIHRHSEVFGSLWKANEGLACLKASASIAHNLGDLDRVMDMWDLSVGDPLRLRFYKLGVHPFDADRKLRYLGRLWVAGELYKSTIEGSSMALENHRHFALRKPRSLRKSPEFLIPFAPFYDDWGRAVAHGLAGPGGKPSAETIEVLETLKVGWERQPKTLAYGRGLRGMFEVHPELRLEDFTGDPERRRLLALPQERFEKKWADAALALMDDIPSRAT